MKKALMSLALTFALFTAHSLCAGTEAHAFGKVKIYNLYNENGRVSVNQMSVGDVLPPQYGSGQVTPLKVDRVKTPNQGTGFGIGQNKVTIDMNSFRENFTVKIPGGEARVSLDDDLLLVVHANKWQLSTAQGFVVSEGEVQLTAGER